MLHDWCEPDLWLMGYLPSLVSETRVCHSPWVNAQECSGRESNWQPVDHKLSGTVP